MLASVYLAFSVVTPLLLLIVLGYALHRTGVCSLALLDGLNVLTFKVFLPIMLFWSIYQSDFATAFNASLLFVGLLLVIVSFGVAWVVIPRLVRTPARRGVLIQGMCRSNFVLFGIPLATSLFGASSMGTAAVMIAFIVPLYNLLSIVVLEFNRDGRVAWTRVFNEIVRNPLIDASTLGVLFVLCGITLPSVIASTVSSISAVALPLALIVLGGTFRFSRVGRNKVALLATAAVKLGILPALFVTTGILLGFRDVELGILLAASASPSAVSSFTMAQQMGGDAELAGQVVVTTTIASIATLFLWIFGLHATGMI